MRDPYKITEPTCLSFSGGRTSAYMLWRVLQSNGGLPADAVVCFANTGKEEEATLRFVRDCAERWSVPITCSSSSRGMYARLPRFDCGTLDYHPSIGENYGRYLCRCCRVPVWRSLWGCCLDSGLHGHHVYPCLSHSIGYNSYLPLSQQCELIPL